MTFNDVLSQTMAMLQQHGRVSYRALKRQFAIDDTFLEDLKYEIIEVQQRAVDHDGTMLVWTGDASAAATPLPTPYPSTSVPPFATGQEPEPLAYTPPHLAEKILTSKTALEGERKQVTVLFADLKGSMELLADRDPEEARQLLDPVLERMMAAVHRYEGTVNQVMGDGIMALFGAPIAHEDHAVRACYAALAMQEAIRTYAEEARRAHGITVQMRVGLNSGEVVVRAIGNDLHMDYSALGQMTHLAARMEQLATPGSILLTADTLRLVEGLVQVTALRSFPVKGLPEPVEVFELVGASTLRGRFQARIMGELTRFVGRETELAALVQAMERAGAGHGQVAALVGEAGVGKSRLVYEFVHSHHTPGWSVLESASVSYGKATPYSPVIDLLKRYGHIGDHDDTRTIRAKLTGQVLTLDDTLQDTLPALLSLLEALPEDSPFLRLDPPQRRQRTLVALQRLLLRESQVQPLLLVFEDLHWIDSETQVLLDSLVERLPTAQLLLLVNYRPEYHHGWGSKTYYTQLRLDPLEPASAAEVLQVLLGDDPSLAPLKQLLIERTEGNPFFLEESVRTLVETGVLVGEPGAYRLAQAVPTVQVPASVQAMLAARIDRLAPEDKRLLQTAAVIGTEVPWPLLQAIAELSEVDLNRGLAHLQAAEFLYETNLFPELEYTFKHALTHGVAYDGLLQERRHALHARIVEAIERLYADRLPEQAERLAQHAFRGEVWDKAVTYFRQAGAKALARSAYREAVAGYDQALLALGHLPKSHDTLEQAIDLHFDLRIALNPLREDARILDCLREAETLTEALGDQRRLGQASAYAAQYFWQMGDNEHALASGQRALAIATDHGDVGLKVMANLFLGLILHAQGHYHQAMDLLRKNVVALQGKLLRERLGQTGIPAVISRAWLNRCHAELGAFTEGIAIGEEGVRIAEAADQPFSLAHAYLGMGLLYLRKGDWPKAISMLEHSLGLCQAWNISDVFLRTASALGATYALSERLCEALPLLEQAVEQRTSMRFMVDHALHVAWLSEGYVLTGRLEDASALAGRALDLSHAHKERGHEAWALRLLGEIAAHQGPPEVETAENYYQQALALAEALGMRPLMAHCHHGLGRLYHQTDRAAQARAAMTTAIDLYRAMDMTFWLPQAEALLARVEG